MTWQPCLPISISLKEMQRTLVVATTKLANLAILIYLPIYISLKELQRSLVVATPIYFGKLTFSHELATHNIFVFVSLKLLRLEKQGQLCS